MTKAVGTGNLFPQTAKSAFIRVTGQRYDNMEQRVRRKGYPGLPFTKDEFRRAIVMVMGGYDGFVRCRYCNGIFAIEQIAIDHAIPLARGGGIELENLDLPCAPCNHRKGSLKPEEYLALLGFLDTKIPLGKTDVLNRLEIAVQLVTGVRANERIIADLKESGAWQEARRKRKK